MSSEEIVVTRTGAAMHIVLNRPAKRNALTVGMYAAMVEAMDAAAADPAICAVIFSGAGAGFCAGNDLADFVANPPAGPDAPVHRFLRGIAAFPKILIAALHGRAIGIGTTMLLHCDFVIAEQGTQLQMPFVDLALVPEAASSLLVPRLVGHLRAAEFLLLGDAIDADRALALGFVSRIVEQGQALEAAGEIAARLAAKPQSALAATRKLMKSGSVDTVTRMDEENVQFQAQLHSVELHDVVQKFFATRTRAA